MLIRAESATVGKALEEIGCFKKGEDIKISFNSNYLLDFLGVLGTGNVEIKLNEPLSPVIIAPENNRNYTYILMPLRTE